MTAHVLPELPDEEPASIWPWLIVMVSGAALLYTSWQALHAIPAELERQAETRIAAKGFSSLDLKVNGRDLLVSGELPVDADRGELTDALRAIPGVRILREDLVIHDPAAAAQARLEEFRARLSAVDTASIAFERGSTSFTADSAGALGEVADLLQENPELRIRIEGHTDNTGRPAVNLRISRERADAVRDWLQARGVSPRQMIAQGYGHTRPIADNATEAGRARNRRIEFSYID